MISPLAYIHPEAKIGENVEIAPFVFIDKNVVIGDNNKIMANANILYGSRIGNGNTIFPGAVIGAIPQDLKFQFLRIFQGIRKEIVHNMIHLIPVHPHLRHVRLCLQLNFHSLLQDGHVELRYLFFQISFDIVRRDFQTFGMQFRFL